MRFDLLTASISPGLYAPLALMLGGILLAVGGLAFLILRRRKRAKPPKYAEPGVEEAATERAGEAAPQAPPETPAPQTAGRRRSLVSSAERDEGTPPSDYEADAEYDAGEYAQDPTQNADFGDHDGAENVGVETAEFAHEGETGGGGEPGLVHDTDPEWIEDDSDASEVVAIGAEEASIAAAASVAAAGALNNEGVEEEAEERAYADEGATDDTSVEAASSGEETTPFEVEAARLRPIVFRQFLPQSPGTDGLSFYGGQPIGPADFQWPREGAAPLQFLMQWDCTQLSEQDATGLLPQEGVLYCFVNCDRDDEESFLSSHAFLHHSGPSAGWGPVDIPEDAGPALGKTAAMKLAGCTDAVPDASDYVPRVMPRFPFAPIALDYPEPEGGQVLWSSDDVAPELLRIQKSGLASAPTSDDLHDLSTRMNRPFPAFPHDFGAIRVIASRMIAALQNPDPLLAETLYADLSPEERQAQFDGWCEEAKELYLLGTQRPEGHRLEANISDDIWNWFDGRRGILGTDLGHVVVEAVDLSLSVSSEALGNVPAAWIDRAMDAHALAREYTGDHMGEHMGENGSTIHAPLPARMFGPPSVSVTDGAEQGDDQILLLELPSGAGPQHDFGGKVLQFWISPEDLAAGRFDEVKSLVIQS